MHLAIDPGLNNIGYACFKNEKLIFYGLLTTTKPKLPHIFNTINDLIISIKPQYCLIETTFVRNNSKTSLKLSEARGVILLSLANHKIPTYELSANSVRKRIMGTGTASKTEIIKYIQDQFNKQVNHNIADAIMLGLCQVPLINTHITKASLVQ